jgi:hypothetical protein
MSAGVPARPNHFRFLPDFLIFRFLRERKNRLAAELNTVSPVAGV